MTAATLLAQYRNCARAYARKTKRDMDCENDGEKDRIGRRNLDARHDNCFPADHGICPVIGSFVSLFSVTDGQLTMKAAAPQRSESPQQTVNTAA